MIGKNKVHIWILALNMMTPHLDHEPRLHWFWHILILIYVYSQHWFQMVQFLQTHSNSNCHGQSRQSTSTALHPQDSTALWYVPSNIWLPQIRCCIPRQGSKPLHWERRVLTTGLSGYEYEFLYDMNFEKILLLSKVHQDEELELVSQCWIGLPKNHFQN